MIAPLHIELGAFPDDRLEPAGIPLAQQHPHRDSQRINVAALIRLLRTVLLRRGESLRPQAHRIRGLIFLFQPRAIKIQQLVMPLGRTENIGRLDIPMDDLRRMQHRQRPAKLARHQLHHQLRHRAMLFCILHQIDTMQIFLHHIRFVPRLSGQPDTRDPLAGQLRQLRIRQAGAPDDLQRTGILILPVQNQPDHRHFALMQQLQLLEMFINISHSVHPDAPL